MYSFANILVRGGFVCITVRNGGPHIRFGIVTIFLGQPVSLEWFLQVNICILMIGSTNLEPKISEMFFPSFRNLILFIHNYKIVLIIIWGVLLVKN